MDTDANDNIEQQLQARLLTLREELTQGEASAAPVTLDQTKVGRLSRMDALQGQALAQETQRRRLREIKALEAALQRHHDGDFGYCARCGEAIDPRRLKLNPAASDCIACATKAEQDP